MADNKASPAVRLFAVEGVASFAELRRYVVDRLKCEVKYEKPEFLTIRADLEARLLRPVLSVDRLREDSLRIVRAARFAITLPNFALTPDLDAALSDAEGVFFF